MRTIKALEMNEKLFCQAKSQDEVEFYNLTRTLLKERMKEEKVALMTGVDENGFATIQVVPMGQDNSLYARILHHISDVFRRIGIRMADRVSVYFYGNEEHGCKSCYHRAEYIVHGILSGMAVSVIILELIQFIAIHR